MLLSTCRYNSRSCYEYGNLIIPIIHHSLQQDYLLPAGSGPTLRTFQAPSAHRDASPVRHILISCREPLILCLTAFTSFRVSYRVMCNAGESRTKSGHPRARTNQFYIRERRFQRRLRIVRALVKHSNYAPTYCLSSLFSLPTISKTTSRLQAISPCCLLTAAYSKSHETRAMPNNRDAPHLLGLVIMSKQWSCGCFAFVCKGEVLVIRGGHRVSSLLALQQTLPSECSLCCAHTCMRHASTFVRVSD